MPEMTVCPVSSLDSTRNVGSSSASRASEVLSLSSSALVLGSMATWITGSGKTIDSSNDRLALGAQGVARARELEADGGAELARIHHVAVLAVVGVHLQQPADALLAILRGVVDVRPGLELAGVDAEVRELADVGIGHDLEGERSERLVVGCLAGEPSAVAPGTL